jgi:hypothetical protein
MIEGVRDSFFNDILGLTMREGRYQAGLIQRIHDEFPGAVVLKNDSGYLQGVPDLSVLHKDRWGMLEVKAHWDSPCQPNQEYYIDLFNEMSYASFVYPENEQEVFDGLQRTFQIRRHPRFAKS